MSIGFSSSSTSLLASGVFTCLKVRQSVFSRLTLSSKLTITLDDHKVLTTIAALALTVNRYGRVAGLSIGGLLQGLIFFVSY